jgi:RNA polymerase sigma-70 factor (ECF subfamily)
LEGDAVSRQTQSASRRDDARDQTAPCKPEAAATGEAFWLPHIGWLRSSLRRRFGPDLGDDLAQETYLRVAERAPADDIKNVRGFLFRVATNLARDAFRRDRVRADHMLLGPESPVLLVGRTAEDDLAIKEAILSLPPTLREVLLLSKIGGLTNREIAQRYGLSARAVDKRLQKALTLFVAKLRD